MLGHSMIGLFVVGAGGARELATASDDPGVVAKTAAILAAAGDRVASDFLAAAIRGATIPDLPAPRGTGDE